MPIQKVQRDYPQSVWIRNEDPYGNVLVTNRHALVELSGAYPLSDARDKTREVGTGSVTATTTGEYRVRHQTGGDEATLLTARHGRYVPGFGAEAGIGMRLEGELTDASSLAEVGYFTEDASGNVEDGFFIGEDANGAYIRVVKEGTQTHFAYQNDNINDGPWNITGHKLATPLAYSGGRVYQIRFPYYGYGLVEFYIVQSATGDTSQEPLLVHTYKSDAGTSVANPNLQTGVRVRGANGTDDFSAYISGRKFHILGGYRPHQRVTTEVVEGVSVGATKIPLISFRRKGGLFDHITLSPGGFDGIVTSNDVVMSLRVGSDITGGTAPVWGDPTNHPAAETALEVDTTADDVDTNTGAQVWTGLVAAGQGNSGGAVNIAALNIEIPDDAILTLCARALAGTATVSAALRVIEEW